MWKSCVYKLSIDNETYVGSTCDFKQRRNKHKSDCYNTESKEYNKSLYKYIREHSHWDNVKFEILVHLHPKFNRVERCSFEQEWIDSLKPTLNKWSSNTGLSKKEYKKKWHIDNKDKIKQYKIDNKEKISEQRKINYHNNKDKISEKQKQFYNDNKDRILERIKQYNIENKDKLNEKFNCECGVEYTRRNKSRHEKSKKHLLYVK
tara:strand:- start:12 stop:626 length:615 start_codon:yes stop_codon:yes gene_type:complete